MTTITGAGAGGAGIAACAQHQAGRYTSGEGFIFHQVTSLSSARGGFSCACLCELFRANATCADSSTSERLAGDTETDFSACQSSPHCSLATRTAVLKGRDKLPFSWRNHIRPSTASTNSVIRTF
ncbi:hypothetical protein KCP76_03285 [Salmonella enterica subsp. enterica serovar Weltevreden]|nr:hypothetical protein KCP76_03285 [Salmonella enterica subsp. enterica serovar Weltevreden]